MFVRRLIRWAGIAAVASGALLAIADVVYFAALHDEPMRVAAGSSLWIPWAIISLLAGYLGLIALVGLYLRQIKEARGLGLCGFLVAVLGTSMYIGWSWSGAFVVPHLAQVAPDFLDMVVTNPSGPIAAGFASTFLLFGLGWTLLGIATARSRVLPQFPSWVLVIGAILILVGQVARLPFGTLVLDVALAWLGWWLWTERDMALT